MAGETATAVDDTHPTGMHSYLCMFFSHFFPVSFWKIPTEH